MLSSDDIREYCARKAGSQEDFPFGPDTLVFKVGGKMYALLGIDASPLRINLKCEPEQAPVLRAMHDCILPGYHMNKEHWNTVVIDGSLPDEIIFKLIDESYTLILKKLPKAKRDALSV